MPKFKDITNNQYGRLTAKRYIRNDGKHKNVWECSCSCGNTSYVGVSDLEKGKIRSCGCIAREKNENHFNEFIGKRFERLVVLEKWKRVNGRTLLKCQCDCGNIVYATSHELTSGNTKSCGCYAKDNNMNQRLDLTGETFGRLKVLGIDKKVGKRIYWKCECQCGGRTSTLAYNLRSGITRSCGCYAKEAFEKSKVTHGKSRTRIYHIWSGMISRCEHAYTPKNRRNYIERGITVCEEWKSFENFCSWSMSHGYADDLTIDRIDNDKGYSPDNCRWATYHEQNLNRRNNVRITFNGETKTLTEWGESTGIPKRTIKYRIDTGWAVEDALTIPHTPRKRSTRGPTLSTLPKISPASSD